MTETQNLTYPLLNPNESEAQIVEIHVSEGQEVEKGAVLYSLETTKSTAEVESPGAGFIIGISGEKGMTILAGEIFAYLASSATWTPPISKQDKISDNENIIDTPAGLRLSNPALIFAKENEIVLKDLPQGPLITLDAIKQYLPTDGKDVSEPKPEIPKNVIIFGGGGHGKAIIELVKREKTLTIVGMVDDNLLKGDKILDVPIIGSTNNLHQIHFDGTHKAINAVGGIGSIQSRINVFNNLEEYGFVFPTIIHPTSFIEDSATLADGIQIFPKAYIGSDCEIGFGVILNTGCIISHDCNLGKYVNISPGAILAGNVTIAENTLIGMGVTINLGVTIGKNVKIGNGATIKNDVPAGQIVRAGEIWPK